MVLKIVLFSLTSIEGNSTKHNKFSNVDRLTLNYYITYIDYIWKV